MLHPFEFRPNHPDELHCVPCAVGMVLEGLTGNSLSDDQLEQLCGFTPGQEVWEYKWMLELADRGLDVRAVEDFDPRLFLKDPRAELIRQTGEEAVVERIFEVSDVSGQLPLVERCLAHPRIRFEQTVPRLSDLMDALSDDAGVLVNLNARALNATDGYAGHLVLLHRDAQGEPLMEDPGPPSHHRLSVAQSRFEEAWTSPNDNMANFIRVALPS